MASRMGQECNRERTTLAMVQQCTSSPLLQTSTNNSIVTPQSSKRTIKPKGCRTVKRKSVSKSTVRSSQEEFTRVTISIRCKQTKSTYPNFQVQNVICCTSPSYPTTRHFTSFSGSKRCILAYTNTQKIQTISGILGRHPDISIQSAPIWAKHSPKSFLQNATTSPSTLSQDGSTDIHVSRRLVDFNCHTQRVPVHDSKDIRNRNVNGITIQHSKIPPFTNTIHKMAWINLGQINSNT